jgi:hypothetical protein
MHGHYVPKISYELIQAMYRKAKEHRIRMTTLVDILIMEGLKSGDIALALEARRLAKKKAKEEALAQARLNDEGFDELARWKNLYPGLRASFPGPFP